MISEFDVVPLRLRHDKTAQLMGRFRRLPKWMQDLIQGRTWNQLSKVGFWLWRGL